MIYFPVINGGTIIASSLGSRFLFKEKLVSMQMAGIIIGVIALFLIVC